MTGYRSPSKHAVPQRVIDGVWDRVDVREPDECWPWKLSVGSHGYGQAGWGTGDGRNAGTTAHRVVWIASHGPIPEGMTVDHTCRRRDCCNPAHLRLLPNLSNATDNGWAAGTRRPSRPRGPYTSPVPEKWCPGCEQTLPAARFHRHSTKKSGLQGYCISCMKRVGKRAA